jgi:uroporphyrinogen decarboxylase
MNSRQRVQLALQHKEADRIPFDLGGTVLTSIHANAYRNLRRYLGLPEVEVRMMDIFQQIAEVDEDLRVKLGCDCRNVAGRSSATFRIEVNETDMPGYRFFRDEWGIGWRMPKDGGFYYDMFEHPFAGSTSIDDIKNFPWPNPVDPARFEGLRERARHVAEDLGEPVILGGLSAGFVELAAWTRGFARFYPDLVTNLEWMTYLMDTIIDLKLAYWEVALPLVGDYADVVQEADDLAGQFSLLVSPETYRKVIKPRHRKIMDFIKARSNAKIFFHSCGAIREIIPDLIDVGIDIINPVQVSAVGMESGALKRDFGAEMTFWGGVVDTQGVFTDGSVQQVRDEVRRRIDDFGPGGGFVAAAVHNIQANVPPQNIMALWEVLQEYGSYGPGGVGQRPADYVPAPRIEQPSRKSAIDLTPGRMPTPEEAAAHEAAAAAFAVREAETPIVLMDMRDAIIDGDAEDAVAAAREGLDEGITPQQIISHGVVPAMTEVGIRFETAKYFLPEMMASAIAARGILEVLRPKLAAANAEPVARVVLGTVKGDLHDIGKNLVSMMMEGAGFEVIDLGTDVSAEQFIAAIQQHRPQMVGLSALLTTTAPMMRHIVKSFGDAGVRNNVKVLVGGAAVSPEYAREIGADGYAPDAGASVRKAKELLALA